MSTRTRGSPERGAAHQDGSRLLVNVLFEHNRPVAVLISAIALGFTVAVFLYNRRTGRRELFLRAHEDFVHPERQQGRRELFEAYEAGIEPGDLDFDRFGSINHAVAAVDVMGYLFYRGYVPRGDAYALWGITVARVHWAAEKSGLLSLRDRQFGTTIWPYVRHFARCVDFSASGGWRGLVPIWLVVKLQPLRREGRSPGARVRGIRYPEPRPVASNAEEPVTGEAAPARASSEGEGPGSGTGRPSRR